jgi:hypothetical protein
LLASSHPPRQGSDSLSAKKAGNKMKRRRKNAKKVFQTRSELAVNFYDAIRGAGMTVSFPPFRPLTGAADGYAHMTGKPAFAQPHERAASLGGP